MPNRSKVAWGSRAWAIWYKSGAIKRTPEEQEQLRRDRFERESLRSFRSLWSRPGNLTEAELEELVGFHFVAHPVTMREQIRRWVLEVKVRHPDLAAKLEVEAEPHLVAGVRNDQEVHDLSVVLSRYVSGFVLDRELTPAERVEMEQEFPRPLKTLTEGAPAPYQVWDRGSRIVQWKAWRQGRPTILGYGMTEQEAIDELRYEVQPDHDGTLDGLGRPRRPLIGGNMFRSEDVIEHNLSQFMPKLPDKEDEKD